jgi:tRNA (guanosine-2'-O-)-methyltransferase
MDKVFEDHIISFISENKQNKFNKVLEDRTRHLTVVLEDIYQPHNASAVLRSCDCFGVQDIHIIENRNKYNVNPQIAVGSAKWLNLNYHNEKKENTVACINELKAKGYKIVATTPHQDDVMLPDLPLDQPIALLFGTELEGLTDVALEHADEFMRIPMYGFTESYNISVSAALCLHSITDRLHKSDIDWHLSEDEKQELKFEWAKKVIRNFKGYEKEYYRNDNRKNG